jgi:hypothetical protein
MKELKTLIDISWGTPITLIVSPDGDTQKFSTIEQAFYWLRRKWPVSDRNRDVALDQIDATMNCMATVGSARRAFISAAMSAGFKLERGDQRTSILNANDLASRKCP